MGSSGSPTARPPGEPRADARVPPAQRANAKTTASPPRERPSGGGRSLRRIGRPLRAFLLRLAPRLGDHLLTLAAGLAAAIPVIAATVKAVHAGWVPIADRGIIATRAHDVLTSHPPLVGQYTLAGEVTGRVTHSLGPMLFWLLALPAHYGSDAGMTVTMGAVNTLCILGCVALARRRGGRALMVMTALAIALMCQSLAAEAFHDIWNPSAGLLPFTLLIFLCWSLACGEYRLLPLTVLVASFVVQTHLTYLPPTLALLAVGLGGLAAEWSARRRRAAGEPSAGAPAEREAVDPAGASTMRAEAADPTAGTARAQVADPTAAGTTHAQATDPTGAEASRAQATAVTALHARQRSALVWGLATVLVAALCWSATVAGQFTEHPGNLTLVTESATRRKATLGSDVGWHAVVRAVGIVPWWLHTPASRWQRKYEVRSTPSALATRSTLAMLAALALVAAVGLLRRRRDVAALALIALVLCPALGAVAASTPTPRLLSATLGYTMWWGSQVGMVVWLSLAWALWLALAWGARGVAPTARRHRAQTASRRARTHAPAAARAQSSLPTAHSAALGSVILTLLGIAAVAAVGDAVARQGTPDEHAVTYRPIKAIDARLARLIPRGGSVLLEGALDGATMPVKPAVRYFLVARGIRVLAPGSFLRLGAWYELYHRPYREAIYLSDVPRPPVPRVPLAFQVSFREGSTVNTVYVWLSRRPGSPPQSP